MKIILSRKGFDSSNGGKFSPIFSDGSMLSLPIPGKDISADNIDYNDLHFNNTKVSHILKDLGYNADKNSNYCHLDPDLDAKRRLLPIKNWKPAFGQTNQAAGYLKNCKVEPGDLFLFFGNFKHVEYKNNKYSYVKKSSIKNNPYMGNPLQIIWGYMQIGEIITNPSKIKEYYWHPHACNKRLAEKNNTLFIPAERLSFAPLMPGHGLFNYNEKRVLTNLGASRACWKYNPAYDVDNLVMTNRKNSSKIQNQIYYAGIWQEIVLKDNSVTNTWAKSIF